MKAIIIWATVAIIGLGLFIAFIALEINNSVPLMIEGTGVICLISAIIKYKKSK